MRWLPLATLVLAQISYPLVAGEIRATLVVVTVMLGYAVSVGHAFTTRGPRVAGTLMVVTTLGGLVVEQLGVHTGFPFGSYHYQQTLGPDLLGVPVVVPLAWTWMAWPAWLVAGRLATTGPLRVPIAGVGLATWDLFLDPQMVSEGYWQWSDSGISSNTWTLPGVDDIPVANYVGWLMVAIAMMTLLRATIKQPEQRPQLRNDTPMFVLYLWTYLSSVFAHLVFLDLPASAWWGGVGMGAVAIPLAVALLRQRVHAPMPSPPTCPARIPR